MISNFSQHLFTRTTFRSGFCGEQVANWKRRRRFKIGVQIDLRVDLLLVHCDGKLRVESVDVVYLAISFVSAIWGVKRRCLIR